MLQVSRGHVVPTFVGVDSKCAYTEQCRRNILHPDRRTRSVDDRFAARIYHLVANSRQTTAKGLSLSYTFFCRLGS